MPAPQGIPGATEAERLDSIREALRSSGGNVTAAAESLGVDRRSMHRWIRRLAGVPMAAGAVPGVSVKVTLEFPKALKDWLEHKALSRKHESGGRFAVSPIVVQILEAARAAEGEP